MSIFTMSIYINKSEDFITQVFFYNNIQYMTSFHITFHTTVFIFYLIMVSIISIYLFIYFIFYSHNAHHYLTLKGLQNINLLHAQPLFNLLCQLSYQFTILSTSENLYPVGFSLLFPYKTFVQLV